jgi:Fic family protein
LFEELKTVPDQLFCLVFFYRLLVDFDADITEIDLIERFSFDDRMISSHFTQKENLNIYYLLRARYFKQKKYTLEKVQALGKFNPLYKYACLFDWVDKQLAILN